MSFEGFRFVMMGVTRSSLVCGTTTFSANPLAEAEMPFGLWRAWALLAELLRVDS